MYKKLAFLNIMIIIQRIDSIQKISNSLLSRLQTYKKNKYRVFISILRIPYTYMQITFINDTYGSYAILLFALSFKNKKCALVKRKYIAIRKLSLWASYYFLRERVYGNDFVCTRKGTLVSNLNTGYLATMYRILTW